MANRTDPPVEPESAGPAGPAAGSLAASSRAERRRETHETAGGTAGSSRSAAPSDRSISAALAEAQAAVSVLAAADTALDEIGFLLRRLRTVAVHAAGVAVAGEDPSRQQQQVYTLVSEIAAIGAEARFNGVRLFDGGLADRIVWVGAAGQPVAVHLEPLDGAILGLEQPWGHANRAVGLPARLVTSTGTLPSGIFRVSDGVVFDEIGRQVGRYSIPTIDFADGVSATFDRPLYYRDDTDGPRTGTVTLNSVISVRNARAVERALVAIGESLVEISRRRACVAASRLQLTDAVATLGVLGASQQADAERAAHPESAQVLTATTLRRLRDEPESAALATEPPGPRRLAGLLAGPGESGR